MRTDIQEVRLRREGAKAWKRWAAAAGHASVVSAGLLGLLYRWFAMVDRYAIFLYDHLGATPFDPVTRSRYWMTGLVASGIVLVGYAVANWALGRWAIMRGRTYAPPHWWQVWALSTPGLTIGIPLITMTVNDPTLPPADAAACVAATLIGLAFALMPGTMAALRPAETLWTALDGLGLIPAILLIRALELPDRGLISPSVAYGAAIGGVVAGIVWLALTTTLRAWRRRPSPTARAILVSGLAISFLLMPLAHHILATPPGYRYISTASNFFAHHTGLQLLALSVAALMAVALTRLRGRYELLGRESKRDQSFPQ